MRSVKRDSRQGRLFTAEMQGVKGQGEQKMVLAESHKTEVLSITAPGT